MDETELIFDEEKINDAQSLMEEIKKDLYDTDCLLYDAVMKIAYAPGIEYVESDETTIDMRMPEKLMIQCRESTDTVAKTLAKQINIIHQFNANGKNERENKPTSEVKEQTKTTPEEIQELYAAPNPKNPEDIQELYAAPNDPGLIQELYAAPSDPLPKPIVVEYGPHTQPITTPDASPTIEPTTPDTSPATTTPLTPHEMILPVIEKGIESGKTISQPRVNSGSSSSSSSKSNSTTKIVGHEPPAVNTPNPVTTPETSPAITTNPASYQYNSIPDTGIDKDISLEDYVAPLAAGSATGIASFITASGIRKKRDKDKNDDEEK